ncbi:MAG TPA: tryptophan 7-halogenase [Terriglobia bacterium]|jgi:FADH2 O2-dependent halogenase|nr:tryptophan 7-halogenase [Terriglobia bacterium]
MICRDSAREFDVGILGGGLSGSMLGAVLAKRGVKVAIIEEDEHPRFAVGESTTPHTSLLISLLAEKYGVPEIEHVAYPERLAEHVCTSAGLKRYFGFCYHRPGETYDPTEGFQIGTASKDENHWFRQDIDRYLFELAVQHGAVPMRKTRVTGVEIGDQGAMIETDKGEVIRARYVVDATGYKRILARRLGLRETPTRLKHHSRTLFTHMVDVPAFQGDGSPMPLPWDLCTLHHCFERGWFWVIPFNNHPVSTNTLVSVGLTMDPRRYPRPSLSPEQEFRQFLDRFPSVAGQLAGAKAARPWVSTGRLQYSTTRSTGRRYCLMSHASGFVDPLFSRGMVNTVEIILALLDPLLNALATDDFDEEAFRHIDRLQQRVLDYNDNLVNGSFIAWSDFDLWNAWLRVWALGTILAEFRLMNALGDYTETRDDRHIRPTVQEPVFSDFEDPDYAAFFREAVRWIEAFEAGTLPASEAAGHIFCLADQYEFPALINSEAMRRAGWLKPGQRMSESNINLVRRSFRWALTSPHTRDLFGRFETLCRWCNHRPDPHLADLSQLVQQ